MEMIVVVHCVEEKRPGKDDVPSSPGERLLRRRLKGQRIGGGLRADAQLRLQLSDQRLYIRFLILRRQLQSLLRQRQRIL